jgi:hypothetical protein
MEPLAPGELKAIAALWRKTGRELVASFAGNSMLPAIAAGQRVRIQCNPETIQPGDVIVTARDSMIVHRAILCTADAILTRGDANILFDLPIAPADVIGRVEAVEASDVFIATPQHRESALQRLIHKLTVAVFVRSPARGARFIALLLRFRPIGRRVSRLVTTPS